MSLALRHYYQQLLARESALDLAPPISPLSFAICYPNTYHVGMSNLGLHAVYRLLNQRCGIRPERAFLPDAQPRQDFEAGRTPLFTLETQQDLASCHLVGFSLQFEEDYANVVTMLRLGNVPLRSTEREDGDPLVLAGGPCATYNPLPLADLVDAFVIGDAEPVLPDLVACVEQCTSRGGVLSREEALTGMSEVEGVFVPHPSAAGLRLGNSTPGQVWNCARKHARVGGGRAAVYRTPGAVRRRVAGDLDDAPASSVIFTGSTEFANMNLIEAGRGCGARCRFCVTGHALGPRRALSTEAVLDVAGKAASITRRIGLVGPSVSDLPDIEDTCERLIAEGFEFSLASMRLESLSDRLLEAIVEVGQNSITVAPEAGTEQLRASVAKRTSDAKIIDCVARAKLAGIDTVRLYFLLGLPGETEEDVRAIGDLARRIRDESGIRRLELSVNVFVPKPMTPFERQPMLPRSAVERRARELQKALGREKGIELKIDSTRWAFVQAVLARGGRELGERIIEAEAAGATIGAWRKALDEAGIDLWGTPTQDLAPDADLPWDFIDCSVGK